MKNVAIITAGGVGKRLPGVKKKQFLLLGGKPILYWCIKAFVVFDGIDEIIVVLPKDEISIVGNEVVSWFNDEKSIKCVVGGSERQISVFNGLRACGDDVGYVFIHDGVRPFVSQDLLNGLLGKVRVSGAVIPVSPVKHTVKLVENEKIVKTVPRSGLYNVFTPQVFGYSLIRSCYEKAEEKLGEFTDDASILEYYGYNVGVYPCYSENIKITDVFDLRVAEVIFSEFF